MTLVSQVFDQDMSQQRQFGLTRFFQYEITKLG